MKQNEEGFVYPPASADWLQLQLQRHFKSFFFKPDRTASLSPPLWFTSIYSINAYKTSQSIVIGIQFHASIWWNYTYIFSTVTISLDKARNSLETRSGVRSEF